MTHDLRRAALAEVDPPPPISESYPAVPGSVRLARDAMTKFAAAAGAGERELAAVQLAVSEALTNAVVHAYDDDPGQIDVAAWLAAGELWVLVADDGHGLRPPGDRPGLRLGLGLISQLSDGFALVNRSCGGAELRMRFALTSSAASEANQEYSVSTTGRRAPQAI